MASLPRDFGSFGGGEEVHRGGRVKAETGDETEALKVPMKERRYLIESRSPQKNEQESWKILQICTFMERKQEEKTISPLSLKVRKLRREG